MMGNILILEDIITELIPEEESLCLTDGIDEIHLLAKIE